MVTEFELQKHADDMESRAAWIKRLEDELADLKDQSKLKREELKKAIAGLASTALQKPAGGGEA